MIEKRIPQIRLTVWILSGLTAFCCFRSIWPLAWQVAAFGALFTLLWPLVSGQGTGNREQKEEKKRRKEEEERQGEGTEDRGQETEESLSTINYQLSTQDSSFILHPSSFVHIGLDLLVTTLLIGVSGGFGSPFAPLVFVVALEAFLLMGCQAAIRVACAAALLNLVHFRSGVTPASAILYGMAMGTLLAAMLTVKMTQIGEAKEEQARGRTAMLIRPPDVADLQAQLETAQQAYEDIKDKYRMVINLHRDQKAQLARTRVVERLCEMGGESLADDTSGSSALSRVLRLVMELMGADGGVLWLRGRDGNTLTMRAAEGRIADLIGHDVLPQVNALTPDAIRSHCEAALLDAAPAAFPARSRLDTLFGAERQDEMEVGEEAAVSYAIVAQQAGNSSEELFTSFASMGEIPGSDSASEFDLLLAPPVVSARTPFARHSASAPNTGLVGVTLLRTRPTSAEPMGKIMGAIGVCDPRGRQRFLSSELEKVSSLCCVLTATVGSICERAEAQKQVREIMLLQELRRIAQTVNCPNADTNVKYIAEQVVEFVMELAPCDNCTLFLLDERGQRLEAIAGRGQEINLLDNIRFERGHGVSGWVASCGRLLHIADALQEPNLLPQNGDSDTISARSFLALPLRIGDTILGVLNLSHALPHAFTPRDLRLLTELADHAAVLLDHAVPLQTA